MSKTLPSLDSVTKLFEYEARALKGECGAEIGADERAADMLANSDPQTIETIQEALSAFQNTRKKLLSSPHSWIIASLSDSICGQTLLWRQLSHATKDSIASIEAMVNLADDNSIEFPENTNVRALFEDACILREHIKNGG